MSGRLPKSYSTLDGNRYIFSGKRRLALTSATCVQNINPSKTKVLLFDGSGNAVATGKIKRKFINKKAMDPATATPAEDSALLVIEPMNGTSTWPTESTGGDTQARLGPYESMALRAYGTVYDARAAHGVVGDVSGPWVHTERDRHLFAQTENSRSVYHVERGVRGCAADVGGTVLVFGGIMGFIQHVDVDASGCGDVTTLVGMTASRINNTRWIEVP